MSPADKRVSELLDRWLTSVELHARYLVLDDAAYAKVQDWPKHQRPTKWVIDLAKARLVDLKRHLAERQAREDSEFADSLELMSFLTTLLGSEHVERFIPLAIATQAGPPPESSKKEETSSTTVVRPRGERRTVRRSSPARVPARTQPKARARPAPAPDEPPPAPTQPLKQPPAGTQARQSPPLEARTPAKAPDDKVTATVIADAVRLLNWGREWPQLAGLIARLADRPPEQEVWEILRTHRLAIESQAKPATD